MRKYASGRQPARANKPALQTALCRPAVEALEDRFAPAAVVSSGTGADAAGLQATIDQFRAVLGNPNNGNTAGPIVGGRREINWDGGGSTNTSTAGNPFAGFQTSRGALMTTPDGGGFVQAPTTGGDLGGLAALFSNPTYAANFPAFSASRLFTPIGGNITDVTFTVPGDPTATAVVPAFGAVFSDVDRPGATTIELFDINNNSLGRFAAPSSNQGLSFVGVSFDAGEMIGRVRITTGTSAPGPDDGGANDIVVMDDFLYGEPVAIAGRVSGVLFNDVNGNGAQDAGEPGQPGRRLFLDANNNGLFDSGEVSTETNINGTYRLTAVNNLDARVRIVPAVGAFQTTQAIVFTLNGDAEFNDHLVGSRSTSANQAFVAQLYRDVLGREPDAPGVTAWVSALNSVQLDRDQVALGFITSIEGRTRTINLLYQELLHRDADSVGLASFLAFLNGGGTREELRALLLSSEEYFSVQGDGSNEAYVVKLYRDSLGREPDASGFASWVAALDDGASRQELALNFVNSQEGQNRTAELAFQAVLRRDANAAAIATSLADFLTAGGERLESVLFASAEYLGIYA